MSVVVSRFSGASVEAAVLGVPSMFLSEEARGQFSDLIDRGLAQVVEVESLIARIAAMPSRAPSATRPRFPPLALTLDRLQAMARDYPPLPDGANRRGA